VQRELVEIQTSQYMNLGGKRIVVPHFHTLRQNGGDWNEPTVRTSDNQDTTWSVTNRHITVWHRGTKV